MTPARAGRRADRLRRRRDDDRARSLLADGGNQLLAQLACLVASFSMRSPESRRAGSRRSASAPLELAAGAVRRRRGDAGAGRAAGRPALARPADLARGLGRRSRCWRWSARPSPTSSIFRLIERAGATNALLVTLLVPPVAILLGALCFGERLGANQFGGLVLIGAGLAVIDGRLVAPLRRSLPPSAPRRAASPPRRRSSRGRRCSATLPCPRRRRGSSSA